MIVSLGFSFVFSISLYRGIGGGVATRSSAFPALDIGINNQFSSIVLFELDLTLCRRYFRHVNTGVSEFHRPVRPLETRRLCQQMESASHLISRASLSLFPSPSLSFFLARNDSISIL